MGRGRGCYWKLACGEEEKERSRRMTCVDGFDEGHRFVRGFGVKMVSVCVTGRSFAWNLVSR